MVRIIGVDIPENKTILVGLTYIYGIGMSRARLLCKKNNILYTIKVKDLTNDQIKLIRSNLNKFILEGDLRRERILNIKRLIDLNTYRGYRHRKGLPVRGQRTKTNAKTCKKMMYVKHK